MAARFNGYYHAKLRVNESLTQIKTEERDNYGDILPIYKIQPEEKSATEMQATLDEAIKKASIALQIHPKSKWVDDCYLLIGKANYINGNYDEAAKAFQLIISQYRMTYPPGTLKKSVVKKRTEQRKAGKKFWWHKLARNEAYIWLVHTYNSAERIDDARSMLTTIASLDEFADDPKFALEFQKLKADMAIQEKDYEQAIESLDLIIGMEKKKRERRRFHFIKGQLQQRLGDHTAAIRSYEEVLSMSPNYEMNFYAQLFKIQAARSNGTLGLIELEALLEELQKDEKNEEFLGSIYYTKALLALNDKEEEEALEYFQLALETETDTRRKSEVYLQLGHLYYNKGSYINSHDYYDSALTNLSVKHTDFELATERKTLMTDLAGHLKFIQLQDSIERWNAMTPEERLKALEKLKKNKKEEIKNNTLNNTFALGNWELYNPVLREKGKAEFVAKWGKRKWEDNWRWSRTEVEDELNPDDPKTLPTDTATVVQITPEDKEKLIESYYRAGVILADDIEDEKRAIAHLEKLQEKFPDNKYDLEASYKLYQLYTATNQNSKASERKSYILANFPDTRIAQQLSNPNFLEEQRELARKAAKLYEDCFGLYETSNYDAALAGIQRARESFPGNELMPRFGLLEALIKGYTTNQEDFKIALMQVYKSYPEHEAGIKAKEIYDNLVVSDIPDRIRSNFVYRSNEVHYLVILVKDVTTKTNNAKLAIADFNAKFYSLAKLKVQSTLFGVDKSMILVKHFIGEEKSAQYQKTFNKNAANLLKDFKADEYSIFLLSKSNYAELMRFKELEEYVKFYKNNYEQ